MLVRHCAPRSQSQSSASALVLERAHSALAKSVWTLTERIHSLPPRPRPHPRPRAREEPPGRDEEDVALERGHALELRRELVVGARAERRARGGVGGVELEQARELRARGAREPVERDVREEGGVGPVRAFVQTMEERVSLADGERKEEERRGGGREGLRDVQGGEGEEGALVEVVPGHERDVGDFPGEELPLGRLR